jgi:hypothetical protein
MLEAGVPTIVPMSLQSPVDVTGMQFELSGLAGVIEFDSITIDQPLGYWSLNTNSASNNQIRAAYFASDPNPMPLVSPTYFVHLKSNVSIALKDAIELKQTSFYPIFSDFNDDVFRLALEFSNAVATNSPTDAGIRISPASQIHLSIVRRFKLSWIRPRQCCWKFGISAGN